MIPLVWKLKWHIHVYYAVTQYIHQLELELELEPELEV